MTFGQKRERRQNASMVDGGQWEDWLPEIIFQDFVVWPLRSKGGEVKGKRSIHFLTRDVLKWLHEKYQKATISDQTFSVAMGKLVVLEKEKCEGLNEDIKWRSAQIKRQHHGNLRGYRIDFEGESKERAFVILSKIVADEGKSQEENFNENVIDMLQSRKPF